MIEFLTGLLAFLIKQMVARMLLPNYFTVLVPACGENRIPIVFSLLKDSFFEEGVLFGD